MIDDLGPLDRELRSCLDELARHRVVERIWSRDHTVWRPDPDEIANRLGWLDLVTPEGDDAELEELVDEVGRGATRDVVLLGMGGSSLGADALRAAFGTRPGFPRLHVLDSTHPSWVAAVRAAIDPATTLFLVASKSGTTTEAQAFYRYFRGETERALGKGRAGRRFVAITDPGSPLVAQAEAAGFRKVVLNPPGVGGRFSVLSRFGLVAAALAGIDTGELLRRGWAMAERCRVGAAEGLDKNPGAALGAALGAASRRGRPFLTLLTSSAVTSFGLWVEQLLAESTGKEGRGILPVTLEPPGLDHPPQPTSYRDDRLFVTVALGEDPILAERASRLRAAGQPVIELTLGSPAELGGELFRWEFATAVAGRLIGIHPFDQPDVEATKAATREALAAFSAAGELPRVEADGDLRAALTEAPRYVAFMAYTAASPELESAIADLRHHLLRTTGVATTFGYGPRLLHSTGQFHKGGVEGGIFVQLLADITEDLAISATDDHSFGILCRAQADGDLMVLRARGRRVLRCELGEDPATGLRRLLAELG